MSENYYKKLAKFQKDNGVKKVDDNLLFRKLYEEMEYEQHCNEQLRNKITNLEYKIKRLEEDNKYKIVSDKIKEYIKENTRYYDKKLGLVEMMGAGETRTPVVYLYGLLELLEEIE